jgi:hypothetical protein
MVGGKPNISGDSLSHLLQNYILTTHFIPEGVAEASQMRPPTFCQNYLAMSNTIDMTGGKSITV